jgi:hypothetical protein
MCEKPAAEAQKRSLSLASLSLVAGLLHSPGNGVAGRIVGHRMPDTIPPVSSTVPKPRTRLGSCVLPDLHGRCIHCSFATLPHAALYTAAISGT